MLVPGLLQKLEEESKVNEYMVRDKLPKEVAVARKVTTELQKIVSEPAMGQADLDEINNRVWD